MLIKAPLFHEENRCALFDIFISSFFYSTQVSRMKGSHCSITELKQTSFYKKNKNTVPVHYYEVSVNSVFTIWCEWFLLDKTAQS